MLKTSPTNISTQPNNHKEVIKQLLAVDIKDLEDDEEDPFNYNNSSLLRLCETDPENFAERCKNIRINLAIALGSDEEAQHFMQWYVAPALYGRQPRFMRKITKKQGKQEANPEFEEFKRKKYENEVTEETKAYDEEEFIVEVDTFNIFTLDEAEKEGEQAYETEKPERSNLGNAKKSIELSLRYAETLLWRWEEFII